MREKLTGTVEYIKNSTNTKPQVGLILGSGLGMLADLIEDKEEIPYGEIPHFPVSTVAGHKGQLVFGTLRGKQVVAMQGRFHFYEGYTMQEVTYPVRVLKEMGVEKIIVTNAAGGINIDFRPGDLMLIKDHIHYMGNNPLIGKNDEELGPRFPDMSEAYNKELRELVKKVALENKIPMQDGVYMSCTGPSYETPAEIRFMRTIGADAVGMSTTPEVIVANHAGIKVIGISCITNMAAGVLNKKLDHGEVMETAEIAKEKFSNLILNVLGEL
ncbi:purine-nucleoside phosphorylase [Desulfitispora alkaliphila]|uniref:purine-nucleoside phosphorylase n=1 Tax=Desulfitispora alkaliphila TaxID=622674 RepID=UPI003D1D31ED